MAYFYNTIGSSPVQGTNYLDYFFAFTKDQDFDHVRADQLIVNFSWTTSLKKSDGSFFVFTGANIQISQDVFYSNGGSDVLYGSNFNDAIFYNNGVFADGVGGINGIQQFDLAGGDDFADFSAHGTGGLDYAKQILIRGGTGNDTLIAGSNNDDLRGDAGNDVLIGNAGGDTILGGDGDDFLYGDDPGGNVIAGQDVLRGEKGNDILYGGAKADLLDGGNDNDILYGGLSDDTLYGGAGNDFLYGDEPNGTGNGGDKLYGDAGDDQLSGSAGNDQLYGGTGNDVLLGGDGDDYMKGDDGDDRLVGGAGNDSLNGNAGIDTAVFSGNRTEYTIGINANGSYQITDLRTAGLTDGSDSVGNVEFVEFADGTIALGALNHPPIITSNGGGSTAAAAISENATFVTSVQATDEDIGQTVSYGIAGGADAALFTIDAATGALNFRNAPDFENPIDADENGIYDVVVQAFDGINGTNQALSVTVNDVNDGAGPVFIGGKTASVAVNENSTAVITVTATDADSPALTYRIVGGADAALFMVDAQTGALVFNPAQDFETPGDADGDNIFKVIVEASDGSNGGRQSLSVVLKNLNDNAPAITSNGGGADASISMAENATAVTTLTAVDADAVSPGFAPTFSIAGGQDANLFAIDAATGALTFKAAPDFELPADADRNNVYDVVVEASDGAFSDQQTLAVTVANINDNAPVVTSNGGGAVASISMAENATAVTTVRATDADGAVPTYFITGGDDASLFAIDAATGALTFKSAPDFEHPEDFNQDNLYNVIVGATDGTFIDTQTLSIGVTDVNEVGRTITGTAGNDTIAPTAAAALRTTALNDTIYGLAGNDTIDGGAGVDTMDGGAGNDIYYVDTYSNDGRSYNDDTVVEAAGGGVDKAIASVGYVLANEVENLTLAGTAAINGTGNALDNQILGNDAANALSGNAGADTILGNDGADTISGGDGNDLLVGGAGNDVLIGGADNDRLDGGVGDDVMQGGLGDDTYIVDAAGDVTSEVGGGGTDVVSASVTHQLADDIENLTLTGSAALDGSGNGIANTINGNNAANRLVGLAGNDTLNGAGGNDVLEGGADTDTLDGGAGNDVLLGGDASDTLKGSAGLDTLNGGSGKDTLTGGTEADTFAFNFGDTTLNTNCDRVTDFSASDLIDLDFVTGSLGVAAYAEASIAANNHADALTLAKSMISSTKSVVFIAGTSDGWLFWDGTGQDGLADQSIALSGLNSLTAFSEASIV